jgi:hypothetical protein
MILLVTPSARVQDCAEVLAQAANEQVQIAGTLQQAITQLRRQEFSAAVIDQWLLEAEPDQSDMLLQHIGTAIPVYINFGISGTERVSREVRAALSRRKREVLVARRSAEQCLRNQLKGPVTALLLSCEMALAVENLPPAAESKIRMVHDLARELRAKLGAVS